MRWPSWPASDSAALSEAFRCAVLRLFVRRGFFDEDEECPIPAPYQTDSAACASRAALVASAGWGVPAARRQAAARHRGPGR